MDNNIICHECGTENEPQYHYCKNCGAVLKAEAPKSAPRQGSYNADNYNPNFAQGNSGYQYQPNANPNFNNTYNARYIAEAVEGIPVEDMETYVGKKSYDVIPKFSRMELTGSKVGWCWPAAILGFLFGPLGAAIWFFYRKMYKIALIFAAVGVAAGLAVTLVSGPLVGYEALSGDISQQIIEGNYEGFYSALEEALQAENSIRSSIASFLDFTISVATMIIAGVFGFYFYKRFSANSINRYRTMSVDPRYYRIGLASVGGTSAGMAVVGVVVMIVAQELLSLISILL